MIGFFRPEAALPNARVLGRTERLAADLSPLSDEELATRAAKGSHDPFAALVKRYSTRIYRVVYALCGDSGQAEDVTQETFEKVFLALPRFRSELSFRPWIYRIALNSARSALRGNARSKNGSLDEVDPVASDKPSESAEIRLDLKAALAAIPLDYRQVLVLRGVDELSFPEIGGVLGIPEATARTKFHRAKRLLRDRMPSHS